MKPHTLGFVFLKPFESGSTANDGGKQIKSPFAGVRIGGQSYGRAWFSYK